MLVPERRLELLHLAARVPETRASTNSAIRALRDAALFLLLLNLFMKSMTLHVWIVFL